MIKQSNDSIHNYVNSCSAIVLNKQTNKQITRKIKVETKEGEEISILTFAIVFRYFRY